MTYAVLEPCENRRDSWNHGRPCGGKEVDSRGRCTWCHDYRPEHDPRPIHVLPGSSRPLARYVP